MVDQQAFQAKILALITEAVPAQYKRGAITPEMRLRQDLGMDSIAMLALLFRFEQIFQIDLATVDVGATLGQLRTVGDTFAVGRDVLEKACRAKSA
jgi:acyl carrier protein